MRRWDRLGYLTWGEAASWGCSVAKPEARDNFLREWREIVDRDRNHPSIIAWTPWNEVWATDHEEQIARTLRDTFALTRALDPTRPVHTSSGGAHVATDIFSVHCYEQTGPGLAAVIAAGEDAAVAKVQRSHAEALTKAGLPFFVGEFGGIKWNTPPSPVSRLAPHRPRKQTRCLAPFSTPPTNPGSSSRSSMAIRKTSSASGSRSSIRPRAGCGARRPPGSPGSNASASASDVEIRDNTIVGCRRTAIEVVAHGGDGKPLPAGAHRGITITGNRIADSAWPNIFVTSTTDLVIADNELTPTETSAFTPPLQRPWPWNGRTPAPIVTEETVPGTESGPHER